MLNIRDYNKNALEVHKKAGELNKKLVFFLNDLRANVSSKSSQRF